MWKLTIRQKQAERYLKDEVNFFSEDIIDLTVFIEKVARYETDRETSYKIERVGVADE